MGKVSVMKKLYFYFLICLASILWAPLSAAEAQTMPDETKEHKEQIGDSLKGWIEKDINLFMDANGLRRLFIRRKEIRAFVHSKSTALTNEAKGLIASFSSAADISYSFTRMNPNIIIVVEPSINEGNMPSPTLWRRLGLPDESRQMTEGAGWAYGCGIYSFQGGKPFLPDGEVLLSLVIADESLSAGQLSSCLTEGIIRSFGLRANASTALNVADGYIQYILVTKAMRHCDIAIGDPLPAAESLQDVKSRLSKCAADYIRKIIM